LAAARIAITASLSSGAVSMPTALASIDREPLTNAMIASTPNVTTAAGRTVASKTTAPPWVAVKLVNANFVGRAARDNRGTGPARRRIRRAQPHERQRHERRGRGNGHPGGAPAEPADGADQRHAGDPRHGHAGDGPRQDMRALVRRGPLAGRGRCRPYTASARSQRTRSCSRGRCATAPVTARRPRRCET